MEIAGAGGEGGGVGGEAVQQGGEVGQAFDDYVDDDALALDGAADGEEGGGEGLAAAALENARPNDRVGDSGFVFEGYENGSLGRSRALAHEREAADLDAAAGGNIGEFGGGDGAARGQLGAQQRRGVRLQRQAQAGVIRRDLFPRRGGGRPSQPLIRRFCGSQTGSANTAASLRSPITPT